MSRVRWYMLALLFIGTTLNYLDRNVLSFLAGYIRTDLNMDAPTYGAVNSAFSTAYMVGYVFAGAFVDWAGTRTGYAVAIGLWSIAATGHALVRGPMGLGFWRAMLGLAESANFPAAIKAVAEWFPKKDRAFATGLFNSGTNVSSVFGPALLVFIYVRFGWRAAFLLTGGLGFVLVVIWWIFYRHPDKHTGVNKAELDYIRSDSADEENAPRVPWRAVLGYRETWGFALAKGLTDPVWWFYLWWLPLYLGDIRKVSAGEMGVMVGVVYLMASVGSVGGGWLSGFFIRRGWPDGKARKTAMAVCAIVMPVTSMAIFAPTPWTAVVLIGLATAAHQGWSANLFTTTSDVFPKRAIGSVVSIGGCAGGLGGALFSGYVPGVIIKSFGYTPVFLAMGCFHITALLILNWLMGDLKPVVVPAAAAEPRSGKRN
jgi:MFS transporter, ACS family, hexuronate transporter